MNIAIIDTGCANLTSVKFACQRLGHAPIITDDVDTLTKADRLLLPGVGTAAFAMQNLVKKNLTSFIQNTKTPLLGICLGMQLLTRSSAEGDDVVATLGVIDATTHKLSVGDLPLPHMGWNSISFDEHPLFLGLDQESFVYFVHSYGVDVGAHTLATCQYGQAFSAVIGQDNFFGMQFHPEKSGKIGNTLLKNFLENL